MSAVEATRYRVMENRGAVNPRFRFVIREEGQARPLDAYRSLSAAEYACRLLNDGLAVVDCHAVLGCKVVAR